MSWCASKSQASWLSPTWVSYASSSRVAGNSPEHSEAGDSSERQNKLRSNSWHSRLGSTSSVMQKNWDAFKNRNPNTMQQVNPPSVHHASSPQLQLCSFLHNLEACRARSWQELLRSCGSRHRNRYAEHRNRCARTRSRRRLQRGLHPKLLQRRLDVLVLQSSPLKFGRPCLRHTVLALPKAAIKSLAM